jgi:elongation factor G
VFTDLVKELQDGLIVPVFLGSAENGNGILRLLKALRHEAPFVDRTGQAPRSWRMPSRRRRC